MEIFLNSIGLRRHDLAFEFKEGLRPSWRRGIAARMKIGQRFISFGLLLTFWLTGPSGARAEAAGALPAIRVNAGGHYLETADGRPFFWLGDTGWKLIHSTTRTECSYYLRTRARQGFTIIQVMGLSEDELADTNALAVRPFLNNDPARPNDAYFDRVAEVVDEAAANHLYVALLPAWGDQLTAPWGKGPRIFREDNLPVVHAYAKYLGVKMKNKSNVVWMLGGDRPPKLEGARAGFPAHYDWTPIWREFAAGIREGTGSSPVFLYHPQGEGRTSKYLEDESWLSINGMQSGHGSGHDVPVWDWVAHDYALTPAKPTLDLEPNYEDHPVNPWPRWNPANGYFRDYDVRKQTYRSVFAGACGVTYGHHAVWQFAGPRYEPINFPDRDWINAMFRPAGTQMIFLRQLMESRPFFSRIPDQALIVGDAGKGGEHMQATRDAGGTYAFIYFPMNDQSALIDLGKLQAKTVRAWWYDPRTGVGTWIGEFTGGGQREFRTPPQGPDWVLVLDDAAKNYAPPGLDRVDQ
jgi:hypothetical protein